MHRSLLLVASLFIFPVLAFASGSGGEHHGAGLGTYWFHFLLYCALIWWIVARKIQPKVLWQERRESIKSQVERGIVELANAEKSLEDARAQLSRVEQDIQSMQENLVSETEHESSELIREAKDKAAYIVAQAKESAEAEQRSAEKNIRKRVAEYVLQEAEKRLRNELSDTDDKGLRDAALQGLSGLM